MLAGFCFCQRPETVWFIVPGAGIAVDDLESAATLAGLFAHLALLGQGVAVPQIIDLGAALFGVDGDLFLAQSAPQCIITIGPDIAIGRGYLRQAVGAIPFKTVKFLINPHLARQMARGFIAQAVAAEVERLGIGQIQPQWQTVGVKLPHARVAACALAPHALAKQVVAVANGVAVLAQCCSGIG